MGQRNKKKTIRSILSRWGWGIKKYSVHSVKVWLRNKRKLVLLLVDDQSHLCMFYHNCKWWSKHSSWSCWIPFVPWLVRNISGELNHSWILSWCHMDNISFGSFRLVLWHRADILWWVFGYCPLSSNQGFLEPMLCALDVFTMEVVSQTNHFFLICISIATNEFFSML